MAQLQTSCFNFLTHHPNPNFNLDLEEKGKEQSLNPSYSNLITSKSSTNMHLDSYKNLEGSFGLARGGRGRKSREREEKKFVLVF